MSNKLSKILLICCLAVCIPLFIAGTVLAVYYSKNATFDVAVYIDNAGSQYGGVTTPIIDTNARTVEKSEDTAQFESYTLTNCHVQEITVTFTGTTGYNFIGWFEGTYEDYVLALSTGENIEYVEGVTLKTTTSEYSHLTAVFNVINYDTDFAIVDPEFVPSEENPEAPVKTDPIEDDDITDYDFDYNQTLPTLEDTENYLFMGWIISGDETGKVYTIANFPTDIENIVLNAKYEPKASHTFTVNYVDENGDALENNTLIDKYLSDYNQNSFVNAEKYQEGRDGYALSWVYGEGENEKVVSAITSDMLTRDEDNNPQAITLTLKKELIERVVNVVSGADMTYKGATTFTVNIETYNEEFAELFEKTNWTHNIYPLSWEFEGVKVGDTLLTSATDLWNYIKENGETTEVVGSFVPKFNEFKVTGGITFKDGNGEDVYFDLNGVKDTVTVAKTYYVKIDSLLTDNLWTSENDGATNETAIGLFYDIDFTGNEKYYSKVEGEESYVEVKPMGFSFTFNGKEEKNYNISEFANIYQLIEKIASLMEEVPAGTNNSIEITNLVLSFE